MAVIDFAPHFMSGNSAPAPFVASASSEFGGGGTPAYAAFNGSGFWRSNAAPTGLAPEWLRIDLGAANDQVPASYAVTSADTNARSPNAWTMEGSPDGSSWTALDTQTGQVSWSIPETRTFTVTGVTTAYRYYRLSITANNGDASFVTVGQIGLYMTAPVDVAPHNMTAASSPSPYVASASTEFSSGFAAWKAFDGVTATGNDWAASTTSGWLKIDLGAATTIVLTDYTVVFADSSRLRGPNAWTMEGSNSGSSWTTLDTESAQTGWGIVRSFAVTPGAAYRYFRFNVSAIQTSGDLVSVTELYLAGTPGGGGGDRAWTFADDPMAFA